MPTRIVQLSIPRVALSGVWFTVRIEAVADQEKPNLAVALGYFDGPSDYIELMHESDFYKPQKNQYLSLYYTTPKSRIYAEIGVRLPAQGFYKLFVMSGYYDPSIKKFYYDDFRYVDVTAVNPVVAVAGGAALGAAMGYVAGGSRGAVAGALTVAPVTAVALYALSRASTA